MGQRIAEKEIANFQFAGPLRRFAAATGFSDRVARPALRFIVKMCPLARAHFVLFCFFLSGCVQQLPLKFPGRRIQRTVPVVDQAY